MIDIHTLDIASARTSLDAKDYTAVELATAYLEHIKATNQNLNAYLEVYDDVLEQARLADARIAKGESTPMLGIPLSLKDNIVYKGKRATAASKILEGFVSPYDATVVKKLKEMGAVFLGRTNMDEFAMGGSTENSSFGVTKNPHNTEFVSGGSSGGSAASVAMDGAVFSLGSDTGGSVRQPASFCGVVGLKPTYGSVSRHGLMAMGSSLDVIGPIGKTIADVEMVFNAIKGIDPMDSTTYPEGLYEKREKKNYTVGVPYALFDTYPLGTEVGAVFTRSIETLKAAGVSVVPVDLPNISHALAVYYILMPAEVSSNLARFDGVKYGLHVDGKDLLEDYMLTRGTGFGKEARRRILLGTYVLSSGYYDAYYKKATVLRDLISKEFAKAFEGVDAIALPTTPGTAFKIGEKINDPVSLYLEDVFTVPANIVGIPAISIPNGVDSQTNLPYGFQLLAPHDCEHILFDLGKKLHN